MNNSIKTPIYDIISKSVKNIPGWCPDDELFALYLLAMSTSRLEGDFLEVGAFCGKSTSALGFAARKINSRVYSVDLFPNKEDWFQEEDGTYNFRVVVGDNSYSLREYRFWEKPFREIVLPIYEKNGNSLIDFMRRNMEKMNLDDVITTIKGTTKEFSYNFDGKLKFVFLDGDHSYEGVKEDIYYIEPYLTQGAIIAFDDAFANYSGSDEAIQELIINSNKYEFCHQVTRKCFIARKK